MGLGMLLGIGPGARDKRRRYALAEQLKQAKEFERALNILLDLGLERRRVRKFPFIAEPVEKFNLHLGAVNLARKVQKVRFNCQAVLTESRLVADVSDGLVGDVRQASPRHIDADFGELNFHGCEIQGRDGLRLTDAKAWDNATID